MADDDLIRRARALGYTVDDRVDGPLQLLLDIHGAAAGTFRARRTIAVSSSLDPTLARATLPHEVGHAEQDRDGTWYDGPDPQLLFAQEVDADERALRLGGPSAAQRQIFWTNYLGYTWSGWAWRRWGGVDRCAGWLLGDPYTAGSGPQG